MESTLGVGDGARRNPFSFRKEDADEKLFVLCSIRDGGSVSH